MRGFALSASGLKTLASKQSSFAFGKQPKSTAPFMRGPNSRLGRSQIGANAAEAVLGPAKHLCGERECLAQDC